MAELTLKEIQDLKLAAKQELFKLQEQKQTILRTRKLWFFKPSPKQYLFFLNSDKKRRAGFCGNRFGKSTLGVVEDVCWLLGFRPFFPEGHPLRTLGIPRHGVKGLVVAEDWDKVKEIFTNNESQERQGKFFEFLPDDCYTYKKNEKGIIVQITVKSVVDGLPRESVVYFDTVKSYKQSPAGFESSDWDFIHIDEPVMKDLWTAVSRGLIDRGGFSWWLLTPIKEPWMYNEIKDDAKKQPEIYWWFEATMDDNPVLADEDKELYLNSLPQDERDARRDGTPLAHGRLVFGDYNEDYHDVSIPPSHWKDYKPTLDDMVVYAIDTHPQTPHAGLFVAINEQGDIDVFDEIWEKCRITALCKLIQSKLSGLRVHYGLVEPAAWNRDQGSGYCYADTFYESGLDVVPGSKQKDMAIMQLQQLFKQRLRKVRIHKRCVQLRKELKLNYFDKDNKPVDKDDHLIECFRRLVIHDQLKYYKPYLTEKPLAFTTEEALQVHSHSLETNLGKDLKLVNI